MSSPARWKQIDACGLPELVKNAFHAAVQYGDRMIVVGGANDNNNHGHVAEYNVGT